MHLFCLAACFLVCVRASGHGVLRFQFLHALDFERTFLFLLFWLPPAMGFLFLFVVFLGLSKRVRVFFVAVFFLACVRASGHVVSCFQILHGLDFERTFTFLFFV